MLLKTKKIVVTKNLLKAKTCLLPLKDSIGLQPYFFPQFFFLRRLPNSQLFFHSFATEASDLRWNICYTQSVFIIMLH